MSHPVIAIHSVIRKPDGEKKAVDFTPGSKFTVADDAEYQFLLAAGAVKDDESAPKPKAAAEKAAAGAKKGGKGAPSDDVVG